MSDYILLFILIFIADYYIFDIDQKRWKWIRTWSDGMRVMVFSFFVMTSLLLCIVWI